MTMRELSKWPAVMTPVDLLIRVREIIDDAYACPEWLASGRTERTDDTRSMINEFCKSLK